MDQWLILSLVVVPSILVSANNLDHVKAKPHFQSFNFEEVCPTDGRKKEIPLRTGMAVFTLDETDPKTKEKLRGGFDCHLELETHPELGFHVYIEEMSLNEGTSTCRDFLQFGRDTLFITNYQSRKYCGGLPKLKSVSEQNEISRLHVEEKDREMDVWLSLKPPIEENGFEPRNLTLIVTVFKFGCSISDPFFKACPQTQRCIRKEFFCDGYVNCAWPNGTTATDETADCADLSNAYSSNSGLFSPSNIPVIIIVILVGLALVVISFITCNRFFGLVKKPREIEDDRGLTVPLGPNSLPGIPPEQCVSGSRVSSTTDDEAFRWPSMPPSYEEAIKQSCTQPPISRLPSDPPPYSPDPTGPLP